MMTSMLPRELASVDWNSAEPFTLNDVVEGPLVQQDSQGHRWQ